MEGWTEEVNWVVTQTSKYNIKLDISGNAELQVSSGGQWWKR
jgi:hypothetical protein